MPYRLRAPCRHDAAMFYYAVIAALRAMPLRHFDALMFSPLRACRLLLIYADAVITPAPLRTRVALRCRLRCLFYCHDIGAMTPLLFFDY